jgi:imidazoleglycerol phosphate synthase cyclase subunit
VITRRILPCLDVDNGRVVKGIRFQQLRDAGDPTERAVEYERQGADEIVILDISATPEGRGHQYDVVREVRRQLRIPLSVGGGVRTADDAGRLFEAGADKVAVNTAAVSTPTLVSEMAERFGSQSTVVAIDAQRANGSWDVVVHSGRRVTNRDVIDWAREVCERGAGEILLTSWDRDGTRDGYDRELLTAVSRQVQVPVIASGGAGKLEHFTEAFAAGAAAVLAASLFHYGETTVRELKQQLAAAGIEVRP